MDKFPLGTPTRVTSAQPNYVKRGLDKLRPGLTRSADGRLAFDPFESLTPPIPKEEKPAKKELFKKKSAAEGIWRPLRDAPVGIGHYTIRNAASHGGVEYRRLYDGENWIGLHGTTYTGDTLDNYEWSK